MSAENPRSDSSLDQSTSEVVFTQYEKDVRYMRTHKPNLMRQYPGEWVGVQQEQIRGVNPDLKVLIHQIAAGYGADVMAHAVYEQMVPHDPNIVRITTGFVSKK